ncbi:ABC transporter ATP-binding protein/permease [Paenibacillus sp. N4]|uniref:ABC transporter ATP-binding protein n=1 Tax=Paenibacillus vietnamensis TaxID=2590547 RepID=UPI001CD0F1EE|nr:ABC transporter ATP-binding protein [Paenibacillus vietnamensis]MCA0756060.1 ABC transporter ATP-binding protein/permease [Paenibacillus vietnamensis]
MKPKRILTDFFRKTWYIYMFSLLFHLISNLINVFYPKVLGQFTDKLQLKELTSSLIVDYSLLLLMIGVGHVLFNGAAQYLVMYVGRRFEFLVRGGLFRHFTQMSERFYSRNGVGKLLSYFMNDVTAVRESISMGFNQTANASMLLVATMTMMIVSGIPYYLILASVLPLLLIPFIVVYLGPIIRKRSLEVQEALGKMTETAEEQFGGIRVTKKFAVEDIMNERFGNTVERIRRNQLRLVRVSSFFQALIPFLGTIALIIALAFGGYLTIAKQMSLGNFVALTLYVRMLMNPLQQIGNVINSIQRSRASLQRLNELLSQQSDIVELDNAKEADFGTAAIRIENLSFSYGNSSNKVLKDIRLELQPGKTLGIIGRTGSGKTTLMKLLLRTCDPPPGTISFGGTDIRELTLESLREQIAYVPQDGFLFSTTIRENIAFYKRDTELKTVETAARNARIYDNIVELPEKFETRLGERGLTLSGGQRQRTSLARGLIKNAPVMILDDSVSAVDAVTEKEIIESIQKERKSKTTIIIAHRISAIKHADEIIVLDGGTIVQRGTHSELLEEPGLYAELHAIQEEGSQHATGTSHS